MELLERHDALATLTEARDAAAGGDGRVVFVTGEPGIGTTALVAQFLRDLEPGARVLLGTCDDLSILRLVARPAGAHEPRRRGAAESSGARGRLRRRGARASLGERGGIPLRDGADGVHAASGGNPFYVTELVASRAAEELPRSIVNAVGGACPG